MIKKKSIFILFIFILLSPFTMVFASEQSIDERLERANNMLLFNPMDSVRMIDSYFTYDAKVNELNGSRILNKEGVDITDYFEISQLILTEALLRLRDFKKARVVIATLKLHPLTPLYQNYLKFLELKISWAETPKLFDVAQLDLLLKQINSSTNSLLGAQLLSQQTLEVHLRLQIYLLQLDIFTQTDDEISFEQVLQQINLLLDSIKEPKLLVRFLLEFSECQIETHYDNAALSELLHAYWLSIENNLGIGLALSNQALAHYYYEHSIFSKAIIHANAAASYYQKVRYNDALGEMSLLLANAYQETGAPSMALNNYISLLADSFVQTLPLEQVVAIYQSVIEIYLEQKNIQQATFYLSLLTEMNALFFVTDKNEVLALFQARIALLQQRPPRAVQLLQPLLNEDSVKEAYSSQNRMSIRYQGLQYAPLLYQHLLETLIEAYVLQKDYLNVWKTNELLKTLLEKSAQQQRLIAQKYFDQYQNLIEADLQVNHFKQNRNEHLREIDFVFKINIILCFVILGLVVLFLVRSSTTKQSAKMLNDLKARLSTDPRSGLKNLSYFYEPHNDFYTDEFLIQSPLRDKLIFALIRLPFLTECYRYYGYEYAESIEQKFGLFIKENLVSSERLYQYNTDQFLYIINSKQATSKEIDEPFEEIGQSLENKQLNQVKTVVARWQEQVTQFMKQEQLVNSQLNPNIYIAMVNYPFIPKAYNAINERQLIDLLLMICSQAEIDIEESLMEHCSWIYLKSIKTAPIASFVNSNIRKMCLSAIDNGLVKVISSIPLINWDKQRTPF